MNTAPVPMPITRPQFRNERIRDFNLWVQDNYDALTGYLASLEAALNDGIKEDVFTAMCVQHDLELARVNREQFEQACA